MYKVKPFDVSYTERLLKNNSLRSGVLFFLTHCKKELIPLAAVKQVRSLSLKGSYDYKCSDQIVNTFGEINKDF